MAALETVVDPGRLRVDLSELDGLAPEVLGRGRPIRLAHYGDRLTEGDFRGHPWARLLVGCALSEADATDARGRRHTLAALQAFRRRGDRQGEAYACFVLGRRALEDGHITKASHWWTKARQTTGTDVPGFERMLAHLGLEAYAKGQLHKALATTEEAVALARLRGARRAEATALIDAGFFHMWIGDFAAALHALSAAEDAFDEVPDPFDRYELPLCCAARGVLWALRGDLSAADHQFGCALQIAREVQAHWYIAIVRALRAEFTAPRDARRAQRDARAALGELTRRGDTWWRQWAIQASAVAAAEAGLHDTAETILRDILERPQAPLEKARTKLLLGETRLRTGRVDAAVAPLHDALATFDEAGAVYWEARCCVRLAVADPAQAGMWMTRARRLATTDAAFEQLFRQSQLQLVAFGPGQVLVDGQPVTFHTHASERAMFMLGLAGPDGLHAEELADRLWPHTPADRQRLLSRIRTLLWDMRQALGLHAWRLERHGPVVRLDLTGATFDLTELRHAARPTLTNPQHDHPTIIANQLQRRLLARWTHEDWVVDETHHNDVLANQLQTNMTNNSPPRGNPTATDGETNGSCCNTRPSSTPTATQRCCA